MSTPLPWRIKPKDNYSVALARLVDAEGKRIFSNTHNDETADFIVKAVNNHAQMLRALQRAQAWLTKMVADGSHLRAVAPNDCEKTLDLVIDAINAAKE